MNKRLIEISFPVREVSEESAKEKNIRHGHISTLHIWWARRPLASSRATAYAALVPAPNSEEELKGKMEFIAELSKWENSNNPRLLENTRKEILEANGGKPPRVIDPFAGGGNISLEALRLGCETYANDLNPVAVLIEKCTLEYPQKYGKKLVKDVKKWGEWVLEEVRKELEEFYPTEKIKPKEGLEKFGMESGHEAVPVGYIWARTIRCTNPSCGAEIPLMRQFWLAKKEKKKISLYPVPDRKRKKVDFKIVANIDGINPDDYGYEPFPEGFDPKNGTVERAVARCLVCGASIPADEVRSQFQSGKAGERMVAVVLHIPGKSGKIYRIATEKDLQIFRKAEKALEKKRAELKKKWGFDPVPDENMNTKDPNTVAGRGYGFKKWGDLFNARQKLALITFLEKVREAHGKMLKEGMDKEYAKAVVSYLAMGVDELARFNTSLNTYKVDAEAIVHIFGRQAIQMQWDYDENNPIGVHGGTWFNRINEMMNVLEQTLIPIHNPATVTQSSATELPYPDNYFDAVLTDPPYYDNIQYSELSDFFYVWLKRSVGHLYPELFMGPVTPKDEEIVANPVRHGGSAEAKRRFEEMISQAFSEIHRVLKPGGIAVIVYAHKTTEGWETTINALLDSGLVVTASWPINTEMKSRLIAKESAALASSIYIVARKPEGKRPIGHYRDVRKEMAKYLKEKLEMLWEHGISGPDFMISAIGAGIEVFGKYEKVVRVSGEVVRADQMLEDVRKIVADFAIEKILGEAGDGKNLGPEARFYILWRFYFNHSDINFDDAKKLAQSAGVSLDEMWKDRKGYVRKKKGKVALLGPEDRKLEDMEDRLEKMEGRIDIVDALHYASILARNGKKKDLVDFLSWTGMADEIMSFGQAVRGALETLGDSKEAKYLDSLLVSRDSILRNISSENLKEWMGR